MQNGEIDRETMINCISQKVGSEYQKPLRQVQFVFLVRNISQISASQFNRQQTELDQNGISQSYIDIQSRSQTAVTPPSFQGNPELLKKWFNLQADIAVFYKYCREQGIEPDDAGFALPRGLQCREQISLSFQAMQKFLDQRLCEKTQWEINEMSWKILWIMKREFPTLAKRLGIKCAENRNLFCDEPYHVYEACRLNKTRPHRNDLNTLWIKEDNMVPQNTTV